MEMDELYWFLEYKPRTETRENIYIMTMVSREPRQIIGHVVSRDKTSRTIQKMVDAAPDGPDRKFCVNADKLSSRKEEQLRGFFGLDTGRLNSAYPPVFRGEKRYARAA